MIFITGGRYQGKLNFAKNLARDKKDYKFHTADGRYAPYEEAFSALYVTHLECFVERLIEAGLDPDSFLERILEKNPNTVLLADEIGSGIVPADPGKRQYQETAGRICLRAAREAEQVYRVICGIGVRIK